MVYGRATHLSDDRILEWDDDLIDEDVVEVGPEPVKSGRLVVPLKLPRAYVGKDESFFAPGLVEGQMLLQPGELPQGVFLVWPHEVVALVVYVGVEADQVERELN